MATVEEKAGSGGKRVSEEVLRRFFREMLLIRRFEEKVEERFRAGELPGFLHVAIGQEAVATGVCSALAREDVFASTHRAHGHAIAKGTPVEKIMAELYGKVEGCSGGYGGSMHLYDLEVGNLGANAVVAGPPESISETMSATSMTVTAMASSNVPNGSPTRCATTSAWCTAASTLPISPTAMGSA